MKALIYTVTSFLITILLWQVVVWAGDFEPALFPSPFDVAKAFGEIVVDGTLAAGITSSLFRFAIYAKIIYTYPNTDSVPKGSSLNSEFSIFKVEV